MAEQTHNLTDPYICWALLFALMVTMGGCRAPSSDWNGTWKLNPSKSSFKGPVFTISVLADGEYVYEDGRSRFSFRCDGKERLVGGNRTRACVKMSSTALTLIQKENGVKSSESHWELLADGRTFTSTSTVFHPNARVTTGQIVASRVSGSSDFAGQWQDTSYLQRHADMKLDLDRGALHLSYPNAGQYIDVPFDGVDVAVKGPHAPEGMTYAAQLVGRHEIHTFTKHNGQGVTQGSLILSDNGRVITESWWTPGQTSDKGVFIYEKER